MYLAFEITHDQDSDDDEGNSTSHISSKPTSALSKSFSESPLSKKSKIDTKPTTINKKDTVTNVMREIRKLVPDDPLPSDNEEEMMTETEQDDEENVAGTSTTSETDEDDDEDDTEYVGEDDKDQWTPVTTSSSNRNKTPRAKVIKCLPGPSPRLSRGKNTHRTMTGDRNHLSKLEQQMDDLVLDDPDGSVVILPATRFKARQRTSTDNELDDEVEMEVSAAKKKKRYCYLFALRNAEFIVSMYLQTTRKEACDHGGTDRKTRRQVRRFNEDQAAYIALEGLSTVPLIHIRRACHVP
jgi:kinesin family protein 20